MTFTYVFVSVPVQLALALALAMLLDKGIRGLAIYRSVYYLPSLLGSSVAIALLWKRIFGADGLFNQFLAIFGIEGQAWISDPDTALGTLITLNVWTFGAPMVIFLAGLRQIPVMYYEAAAVDGAGRWRRFRSITLPLLSPIIFFNLVLQIIHAFQSFTQAFIVSGGYGRAGRLDHVLHPVPVPKGLRSAADGLRVRHGLGAPGHHRHLHRYQLLLLEKVGLLR